VRPRQWVSRKGSERSAFARAVNYLEGQLEEMDDPKCLTIESVRRGEVKGDHSIRYESGLDSITLSHKAKSRNAFAAGALMAAGFIRDKTGVFGMGDLLKL